MPDVTISQFAQVLKVPVERLLDQLDNAGIKVGSADDTITDSEKKKLLNFLRESHGREPATTGAPRKISIKRKQQSEIRLPGSQGRARTVAVEVRKKRTYVNRGVLEEQAKAEQAKLDAVRSEEQMRKDAEAAVLEAKQREVDELRLKEKEQEERQAEEAREKAQREAQAQAEAEARVAAETKRRQEQDARRKETEAKRTRYGRKELHVAGDKSGRRRKKRPARRNISVASDGKHGFERPTAPVIREVELGETITVGELSQSMAVKATDVIKTMMGMGMMVTINQVIDQDTAQIVVEEMGHTVKLRNENLLEDQVVVAGQAIGDELPRAPVVTVMGHVDHGKTSLLDYIRDSRVASGEAGGITQHIGAYRVKTKSGEIAFLDTPGHEAFSSMRARGSQVTDIVILVVAADDGVMPQTKESVLHARAAKVPLIVAINKMDRPDADPERVKNELSALDVIPEDWGGDTQMIPVSAQTGEGVDALLEAISLQAEVLELKATREGPAAGVVLESSLEKGRGAVATVLVSRGKLSVGEIMLAGQEFGRIRAMFDEKGESVKEVGPSTPVVVLGLSGTPNAGDDMLTLENERKAREVAESRQGKHRDLKLARQQAAKMDSLFSQMEKGERSSVNLLIKADVQGSAEALRESLTKLSMDEVVVKVIMDGVGGITESEVNMAAASNAIIIGFNVRADAAARTAIKEHDVDLHYFSVIYEAIDTVKKAISGYLKPEIVENIVGLAQVKDIFRSPKFGNVAGCIVLEGFVQRNLPIRVLRDNVVIYEGELESLRRFKDDVNEVRSGTECGIGVRNYNDVKVGDQIECFQRTEVARTL